MQKHLGVYESLGKSWHWLILKHFFCFLMQQNSSFSLILSVSLPFILLSHTLNIFSSMTYIIFESYNGNMMWFGVFQI